MECLIPIINEGTSSSNWIILHDGRRCVSSRAIGAPVTPLEQVTITYPEGFDKTNPFVLIVSSDESGTADIITLVSRSGHVGIGTFENGVSLNSSGIDLSMNFNIIQETSNSITVIPSVNVDFPYFVAIMFINNSI